MKGKILNFLMCERRCIEILEKTRQGRNIFQAVISIDSWRLIKVGTFEFEVECILEPKIFFLIFLEFSYETHKVDVIICK